MSPQAFRLSTSRGQRNGLNSGAGFTLVEMLVVIAIIAVLVSIMMPALVAARRKAQDINCASQQRQIGLAMAMYLDANRGWLPFNDSYASSLYQCEGSHAISTGGTYDWPGHYTGLGLLYSNKYLGSAKVLWCPSVDLSLNFQEAMGRHFSNGGTYGSFTNPNPTSTVSWTSYRYRLGVSQNVTSTSYTFHPSQRAIALKGGDKAVVFCGASNVVSGGNTTLKTTDIHGYRGFNLLLVDGSVHWFDFKIYKEFPNTNFPQNGQQVGGTNAANDSYGNRYRRDFSYFTMRRAGLVFHNQWRNPQSSPTFNP